MSDTNTNTATQIPAQSGNASVAVGGMQVPMQTLQSHVNAPAPITIEQQISDIQTRLSALETEWNATKPALGEMANALHGHLTAQPATNDATSSVSVADFNMLKEQVKKRLGA